MTKPDGLTARNVTRWLGTQDRLAAPVAERRALPDDARWALRAGDLVVVDESAMTDTASLAAIHAHVDRAGAKLLLVGDHRQLAAVGAGGGMDLLANAGAHYELADARRVGTLCLAAAARRGRKRAARLPPPRAAARRRNHRTGRGLGRAGLAGRHPRRETVAVGGRHQRASRKCLCRAACGADPPRPRPGTGRAPGPGRHLCRGRRRHPGRHNAWHLAGLEGNRRGPLNREKYRVTAIRPDGGLEVTTGLGEADGVPGERMVLPGDYVGQHVALAYAGTVNAAQGATVDTAHTVVTSRTSPNALYVGMSRGRDGNTAHVATVSVVEDEADGRPEQTIHRNPVAALASVLDPNGVTTTRSALATATGPDVGRRGGRS